MLFRERTQPWVVAGSMGGDIQPQIHVQLVSALVDGGADIRTAVAAPRVVVQPAGWFAPPVAVVADGELAPGVGAELAALGHEVGRQAYDGSLGHEHAIELSTADRPQGPWRRSPTPDRWGWPPSADPRDRPDAASHDAILGGPVAGCGLTDLLPALVCIAEGA